MTDFDKLNKATKDYNNGITRNIDPTSTHTKNSISEYWINYWNNQTYKKNNGQYSTKY